jgi:ParB/RepB/Spo0J family partition protein
MKRTTMQTETLTIEQIPIHAISESLRNPRQVFRDIEELADNIKSRGVLQPILVRPEPSDCSNGYEIVFGARRFRASKLAGLETIPAMIREIGDEEALEIMVIENAKRSDVHPLEEARGYHSLQHEFGQDVTRIAARVGRSVAYVYDRMKLLNLTAKAQELFLVAEFTAGHAVILARLDPDTQARVIEPDNSILFRGEQTLFDPNDSGDQEDPHKPISVRELQAWVDGHVKLDKAAVDPMLFPVTAMAVKQAEEDLEKVVQITRDYQTPRSARDGTRIYTERSWKRADGEDGSKHCDRAVIGVVVVGFGRGESFRVCIDKKRCAVHWAAEQKTAKKVKAAGAKATTGEDRWAREEAQRAKHRAAEDAKRQRWAKARPAVMKAIDAKLRAASAKPGGALAKLVMSEVLRGRPPKGCLPPGRTAEDFVRYLASASLHSTAGGYFGHDNIPRRAKALGVDVAKIIKEVAPEPKAEKKTATPAKPKAGKKVSKKKAKARKTTIAKKIAKATPGVCGVCGCTDDDCRQCIEATGHPCHWVDIDRTICSRCMGEP